jgi:hypothetical protein
MATYILELNPDTVDDGDGLVFFNAILDSDDEIEAHIPQAMWKAFDCPKAVLLQVIK